MLNIYEITNSTAPELRALVSDKLGKIERLDADIMKYGTNYETLNKIESLRLEVCALEVIAAGLEVLKLNKAAEA